MRLWSDFHPLTLTFLPGCAEIAADTSLRQAAIEFCTSTLALQVTLDPITSEAGTDEYEFEIGTYETVAKLLAAQYAGVPLNIARPADFDPFQSATGTPTNAYVTDGSRTFFLWPTPSANNAGIVARVALRPSQDAPGCPDVLFDGWASAIAAGAVSLLALQPGRSYSNPPLGLAKRAEFEDAIVRAKVRAFYGNSRASPRVAPSFF